MSNIAQLLEQAAIEVRQCAASATRVGLESGELEQLADRLMQAAKLPADHAAASLAVLARVFGDDRDVWASISPAFVALMDAVRAGAQ
ncbi:hypothetical protein DWG18_01710 [Lysobacter sp. TY2-98]|uniref:hypothetical protein n=1 Tax=Lysobacter sp. TY2-98 TaxID=2290922 RepID=UPI000E1FF621|nr:hypothetical protein [Lysobacter sp. TY2-98]AXK71127.1 hypothetical protein DWG18_01710 [Lysobacter sp. TY2-98]